MACRGVDRLSLVKPQSSVNKIEKDDYILIRSFKEKELQKADAHSYH